MENYSITIKGLNQQIRDQDVLEILDKDVQVISFQRENDILILQLGKKEDITKIQQQQLIINGVQLQTQWIQYPSNGNEISNKIENQDEQADENDTNQYRLLIKGIPPLTNEFEIKSYLATFGTLENVSIKKHQTENKNLGYGYVEFQSKQVVLNILQQQQLNGGSLTIPQTKIALTFEKFSKEPSVQYNNITINQLYEYPIKNEQEKGEKNKIIISTLDKVKQQLLADKFSKKIDINVEFNNQSLNFSATISFSFQNQEQEENIFNAFKNCIFDQFAYSDKETIPQIQFYFVNNSSKQLIFIGLKDFVNSNILSSWITENFKVKVEPNQIIFLGQRDAKKQQKAVVYLNSEEESEEIFCNIHNKDIKKENILELRHKISIYLKPSDLIGINQKVQKTNHFIKRTYQ